MWSLLSRITDDNVMGFGWLGYGCATLIGQGLSCINDKRRLGRHHYCHGTTSSPHGCDSCLYKSLMPGKAGTSLTSTRSGMKSCSSTLALVLTPHLSYFPQVKLPVPGSRSLVAAATSPAIFASAELVSSVLAPWSHLVDPWLPPQAWAKMVAAAACVLTLNLRDRGTEIVIISMSSEVTDVASDTAAELLSGISALLTVLRLFCRWSIWPFPWCVSMESWERQRDGTTMMSLFHV